MHISFFSLASALALFLSFAPVLCWPAFDLVNKRQLTSTVLVNATATATVIATAPAPTTTDEVCVEDPLYSIIANDPEDSYPFGSSYISIPLYTTSTVLATDVTSV